MSDFYDDRYLDRYGGQPEVPPVVVPPVVDTTPSAGNEIGPPHVWRTQTMLPNQSVPSAEVFPTGRSITLNLGEASTYEFTMSGLDPAAANVDEFITDVFITRDGRDMLRARVGASDDSIDASSHTVNFTATDYRGLLDRRYLSTSISTTGDGNEEDQNDIVWRMIDQTQTDTNGALGIVKSPVWVDSGVARKDVWPVGTQIGQAITEMGLRRTVDGLYGFDWDITPDLRLYLYSPVRGTVTGFSIEHGVNCDTVTRSLTSADYANRTATQWTNKEGQELLAIAESADLNIRPEGLWEEWGGGSWMTVEEGLAYAEGKLSMMQGMLPSYECHLMSGRWDPQSCWLGDTVSLTVQSGRLNVRNVPYRVQTIKVDINDDGSEDVTVTLGVPVFKLATQLNLYGRSIADLERR